MGELSDHLENALASAQVQDIDSGAEDSDEEWEDEDNNSEMNTGRTFKQTELSRLLGKNKFLEDQINF